MKKLLLTLIGCLCALVSSAAVGAGVNLYMIGAGVTGEDGVTNSWQTGKNMMTNNGDGTFTWSGKELKEEFKINNGGWSSDAYNFGGPTSNAPLLVLGEPYTVVAAGSSTNIKFANGITSVINPTVVFDTNTMKITVTGAEDSNVEISLAGSFNNNNQSDNTYNLTEGADQVFTGTFTFAPANPLKFQVIVNHSSWLGYKDNAAITFNGTNPVTKDLASGYQNDFEIANWPGGEITFTVNYAQQTVTLVPNTNVEITYPDYLYLIGDSLNGSNGWDLANGQPAEGEDGIYVFKNAVFTGSMGGTDAYFGVISQLGSSAGDWDGISSYRYQPKQNDQVITSGDTQEIEMGSNNSWKIAEGTYNITVNLKEMEISVVAVATEPEPGPEVGEDIDVTFQFDSIEDDQKYIPGLSGTDGWPSDTSNNKYYNLSDITYNNVSLSFGGNPSTATRLYYSSGKLDVRIYNGATLTVSVPENYTIQEIVIDCPNSTATTAAKLTLDAGQPGSWQSANKVTSWTATENDNVNSLNFTSSATIRISSIKVTAVALSGTEPEPETITLYLVGDNINGEGAWNTNYPMESSDNVFTWSVNQLGSKFKITDDPTNWGGKYNIGTGENDAYKTLQFGEPFYYLNDGNSVNIAFAEAQYHLINATVTLDLNAQTVTVNGEKELNQLTAVYLAGTFNDWSENQDALSLNEETGNYESTFSIEADSDPSFKMIFQYGEVTSWFGAEKGKEALLLDGENPVVVNLVDGENIVLEGFTSGDVTFTVNPDEMTLTVSYIAPKPLVLYLVGDNINGEGNWSDKYEASSFGNEFTWTVAELGTNFKITDDPLEWKGNYNLGTTSDDVTLNFGEAFKYWNDKDSKNINFTDNEYYLKNATVTLNLEEGTITVTGDKELSQLTGISLAGNFNGWNADASALENEDGLYKLSYNFENVEEDPTFKIVYHYGNVLKWYGADAGNADIELDGVNPVEVNLIGEGSSDIVLSGFTSGEVTFTVDIDAMLLTVDYKAPVVGPDMATYKVYAYNSTGWDADDLVLTVGSEGEEYDVDAALNPELVNGNYYRVFTFTIPEGSEQTLVFSNGTDELEAFSYTFEDEELYVELTLNGVIVINPDTFNPTPDTPTTVEYGIYVYNATNWSNVYMFFESNDDYPGVEFTETATVNDVEYLVYYVELEEGATESLVFNNGENEFTDPLEYTFEESVYIELTNEKATIIDDPYTFNPDGGSGEGGDGGEDGPSSVESILYDADTTIYTLQGIRVDANKLTKGIYIINGKKVMVK